MQIGQIISLTGDAIYVSSDGTSRPAEVNDFVTEGDQILLLGPNSSVLLITPQGEQILLNQNGTQPQKTSDIEELLLNAEPDLSALPSPSAGPQQAQSGGESDTTASRYQPISTPEPASSLLIDDAPLLSLASANSDTQINDTETAQRFNFDSTRIEQTQLGNSEVSLLDTQHYAVTEDFVITRSGNLNHQFNLSEQALDTTHGRIEVDAEGRWQYKLNNDAPDVQSLGAGESLQERFSLYTRSGDYVEINLTIHGSNDTPTISGDFNAPILEDNGDQFHHHSVGTSGQLSIIDADNGQSKFLTQENIVTPYGTASITGDGAWSYLLNSQSDFVQGLKEGQHVTDSFHVYTQDGMRQTLRFDIEGSNDKPILSGQNDGLIYLGQNDQAEGQISIIDPDFGESGFQSNNEIVGKYGTASISADGHWRYTMEGDALASLQEGKKAYDVMDVYTLDGTRQDLIIKIVGTSANTSELNAVLQDTSTDASLDTLIGSATTPGINATIASGESLSIELADTMLLSMNQLTTHVDVT